LPRRESAANWGGSRCKIGAALNAGNPSHDGFRQPVHRMIGNFLEAAPVKGRETRGGPSTEPSSLRPAIKRADAPSRSIQRNPVTGDLRNQVEEDARVLPLPFPCRSFPILVSDQARIPYHRSLTKRLKDKREEERAELLSQIRSRSSLPTSEARPPTPPKQRRYGGGAGVGPSLSMTAHSPPRRSASASAPQHSQGGARRKQIVKHASFELNSLPLQQLPFHNESNATTDIFGKEVGQLDAFDDDSLTELITWTRFRK
jgi:hypothetical protein